MDSFIYFSVSSLWIVTLILSVIILKLLSMMEASRKRKVLAKNDSGISKGVKYPIQIFKSINGAEINILDEAKGTVLLFTEFSCNLCKRLYPILPKLVNKYKNINFITIMLATHQEATVLKEEYNLNDSLLVLIKDEDLVLHGLTGFPFAYYLSAEGKVIEKGIVNYMEHFEILLANHIQLQDV